MRFLGRGRDRGLEEQEEPITQQNQKDGIRLTHGFKSVHACMTCRHKTDRHTQVHTCMVWGLILAGYKLFMVSVFVICSLIFKIWWKSCFTRNL